MRLSRRFLPNRLLSRTLSERLAGILALAAIWEIVARTGLLPRVFFPPLSSVVTALIGAFLHDGLAGDELLSLERALTGMLVASCIGIAFATLTSSFKTADRLAAPLIEFLRPLPPAAIIPLAIFFVGIGPKLFLFTIVFAAVWPIYINAANALRSSDRTKIETGRSFGCGRLALLVHVRLPGALPEILTGLRVGMSLAILATVLVEMLAGRGGVGYRLYETAFSLHLPEMYGVMILTGINGLLCNALVVRIGHLLAGWHYAQISRTAAPGRVVLEVQP